MDSGPLELCSIESAQPPMTTLTENCLKWSISKKKIIEWSILGVERPHSGLCQWQHLSLRNTRDSLQMTIWPFF